MQVVEGYQVGNTERQLMAPTLVAMASNLRVMASIQNRHQRCTSFLAPDVTLSVCGNGSFGTLRRCLGTTCHLSEVPALSLLGAPGLTTRNKDATRDSCVFFFTQPVTGAGSSLSFVSMRLVGLDFCSMCSISGCPTDPLSMGSDLSAGDDGFTKHGVQRTISCL